MKKSSFLFLLTGLLLGTCIALFYQKSVENRRLMRAELKDWRKVNLILKCIDENYVDTIDRETVTDATIAAALHALDPHSVYMPPVELEETETALAGNFEGIGIQFNVPNDTAIVIETIPGGPSEKIGVLAGDRILKVDTTVIAGVRFPQDSMVRRMKGPAGSKVLITIGRGKDVIPFEITRDKIPMYSVDAAFMVNDTTGYIRLGKFARTTYLEVLKASAELMEAGMKNLIFDLRENTGGYFDQALTLSNLFLEKGQSIVYMEGRQRKREEYRADGKGILKDVGLAVLIDEHSASSSEIFAGAIQGNARGKIVGRRSFGKGLVQEPYNFTDGSGIRLTVARYYTPDGRCIQKSYTEDYEYEVYERYNTGEMVCADSMKIEKGGIIPDVFVPADTTRAGQFYVNCNRKATPMRFASAYFDSHRNELAGIDDYDTLLEYLHSSGLEQAFLNYARSTDSIAPTAAEWAVERSYMMTQIEALVGRYSKLADKAFYHIYLQIDDCFKAAIDNL